MSEKVSKVFKNVIQNRRELTFFAVGFLIFIVLVSFLYSDIRFLVESFNSIFDISTSGSSAEKQVFNLDEAKAILSSKK